MEPGKAKAPQVEKPAFTDGTLTARELARILGKSHATIWRWTSEHMLDDCIAIRSGNRPRYSTRKLIAKGLITEADILRSGLDVMACLG